MSFLPQIRDSTAFISHAIVADLLALPADVHFRRAQTVLDQRQQVLHAAYLKNPERFVKGVSVPTQLPAAVWINPPNAQLQPQQPLASSPS